MPHFWTQIHTGHFCALIVARKDSTGGFCHGFKLLNLMSILIDILKELPLFAVLREKLLLQAAEFEAKIIALEAENKVLKAENAQLKTKVQHLENKIQKIQKENAILKKRYEESPDWGDIEPV